MNSTSDEVSNTPVDRLSSPFIAVTVPAIATFVLFVLAAILGGAAADQDILILARFLGILILVLGIYVAVMAGRRCAYSLYRWLIGQTAAGSFGLAAGFVWSGSAFGFSFFFLLVGIFLCALLVAAELQRRSNRRLARQRSERDGK